MQTLQNLLDSLSRRLRCAVSLDDRPLQMMFHSCKYGRLDEARVRRMLSSDRDPEPEVRRYVQDSVRPHQPLKVPLRIGPHPGLGIESRLFLPVRYEDENLGNLMVFDPEYRIDESEYPAIIRAAAQAAQIIRYEQILWDPDRNREHDLLSAMLYGDEDTRRRAAREARRTGLMESGPASVFLVSVEEGTADAPKLKEAIDEIRGVLTPGFYLLAESDDTVQILVSHEEPAGETIGMRGLAQRIVTGSRARLTIGIGEDIPDLVAAPRSLQQARMAHSVAGRPPFQGVACWSELGALRLLLQLPEDRIGDAQLVPEIEDLREAQPVLFETLDCFLRNAGHAQRTAQELFIHRATLHYRLRKIEEMTRRDLDSGEDRLALHLGVKVAQMRRPSGE